MKNNIENQVTPVSNDNGPVVPGVWHAPGFRTYYMAAASGDLTTGDDGLGEGLFSGA